MIRRCYRENCTAFKNYGGRGITVCDRWRHGEGGKSGLACFIEDLGQRPTSRHSIHRIDNDGRYDPANCKWALPSEQMANARHNSRFGDEMRALVYGTPAEAAKRRTA